ncbi:aldo/keto reductase [Paenibacillus pasadenensis]|uniref:aldo/keto reductase n=1 Tax=Paenibacillus pasadenensis TaxID=217090 RepID=UPI00203DA9EB|nr:aldo/keto reductase [Paenibacillus pasadenensis]MCM3749500.1 aldo/keto reductase [Paenibacillus pasadenensis]
MNIETSTMRRKLGNSNLMLSPLGLGCWQFSGGKGLTGKFWPVLPKQDILNIVQTSLAGGINWFDTAEIYGGGESEQVLAAALKAVNSPLAKEAHIATKWWPAFRTASSIGSTIGVRLQMLDHRTIHLHQVHQPFSFSSATSEMNEMAKLVKQGKIENVGVSNFSAAKMREADQALKEHGLRLVSNQVKYSLLDRRIEQNGVLDTAKELGVAIIAYSPLEQGLLSGKFHRNEALVKAIKGPRKFSSGFRASGLQKSLPLIEVLENIAAKHGATPTQVALNWMIHSHGQTVFAIPGATKVKHAEENVSAMKLDLNRSEIEGISAASWDVLK